MTDGLVNALVPSGAFLASSLIPDVNNWGALLGAGGAFVWLLYVSIRQEKRLTALQAQLDDKSKKIIEMSERLSNRCGTCELAKAANKLLLNNATNNNKE